MNSSKAVDMPHPIQTLAIQGELGSNSHMAALSLRPDAGDDAFVTCNSAAEVFEVLAHGVERAVLPIENSLHGSVFEHYDLLLENSATIVAEILLKVTHNVIAMPGVALEDVRRVLSHPVALSQCRKWLRTHPQIEAIPCYDTAGGVKRLMAAGLKDTAGIAPALAAQQYGGTILVAGIEDHVENYTRFYVLSGEPPIGRFQDTDKLSLVFSLEHRPGSLLQALQVFHSAGLNLTKIESRPVHGRPWEYVFFVDLRFTDADRLDAALADLASRCKMLRELGRYRAA